MSLMESKALVRDHYEAVINRHNLAPPGPGMVFCRRVTPSPEGPSSRSNAKAL